MFSHLRTKLTVLYTGLFAAILAVIAFVALAAVADNARRMVKGELSAGGVVFEHSWAQRAEQLRNDAVLLSRDFGFRTAVASNDDPTIRSALENLKVRLGVDQALMVTPEGRMIAADGPAPSLDADTLAALEGDETASGVVVMAGAPHEAVSSPIEPGGNAGWVVFISRLDRPQMAALEAMASIPFRASVAYRIGAGRWRDNLGPSAVDPVYARVLDAALTRPANEPQTLAGPGGQALVMAWPLHALAPDQRVELVLQYPQALAMAPYRSLLTLLIGVGAVGFLALLAGSWAVARNVTRPISSLEAAARRLRAGERAAVSVQTRDEIGRLADSFNSMASEIHQRERELEGARDQAEAANRAKSSFLTNMSHEVRTPLNGVIGVAEVLAATPLEPDQQQMLGIIRNSAGVLQRVLDDVLDLASVEAGRLQIINEDFDLGLAMAALGEATAVQCRAKGLAFHLDAPAGPGPVLNGDRVRLEQILGNLVSNAVKFTEHGRVAIRVAPAGEGAWTFEVSDSGVGFDPAITPLLFKPFQQADNSLTRKFGGSGLGLSLSRDLAEAMGGRLDAAAVPGEGATFTLTLPLTAGAAVEPPPPTAAQPAPAAADQPDGLRILVADDHETNRRVVKLILDSLGVEVACAEDGAQAVAAFTADGGFDLVLMDMQMPVMDGLTAIRAIRAHEAAEARPRTPILVLSANAMPEHVAAAHAAGADAHIAKPITPPRLIAALDQALSPPEEAVAASA